MAVNPPTSEQWQAINRYIVAQFRENCGNVPGRYEKSDLLLLTTTGARSGEPRVVPLSWFIFDGKLTVIGSNVGAEFHPGWVHNLRSDPTALVEMGTSAFDVTARELALPERQAMFQKIIDSAPRYADYQANTRRLIPLFELQRS